jgi:hypothetical protein
MDLGAASGRSVRFDAVDGRASIVVDLRRLERPDDDFTFPLHVDQATRIVLWMTRTDIGLAMRTEDFRVEARTRPSLSYHFPPPASCYPRRHLIDDSASNSRTLLPPVRSRREDDRADEGDGLENLNFVRADVVRWLMM